MPTRTPEQSQDNRLSTLYPARNVGADLRHTARGQLVEREDVEYVVVCFSYRYDYDDHVSIWAAVCRLSHSGATATTATTSQR